MKRINTVLALAGLLNAFNVHAGCYIDKPYICRAAETVIVSVPGCIETFVSSTGTVKRATGIPCDSSGLDNISYVNNDCIWTTSYIDCSGNPHTDTNHDSTQGSRSTGNSCYRYCGG